MKTKKIFECEVCGKNDFYSEAQCIEHEITQCGVSLKGYFYEHDDGNSAPSYGFKDNEGREYDFYDLYKLFGNCFDSNRVEIKIVKRNV